MSEQNNPEPSPEAEISSLQEELDEDYKILESKCADPAQLISTVCSPEIASIILDLRKSTNNKPIHPPELKAYAHLWNNWKQFQSICSHIARTTTKKLYELKNEDRRFNDSLLESYYKVVKPTDGNHLFKGTPAEREGKLYETKKLLKNLIDAAEEILQTRKKELSKKIEEEKKRLQEKEQRERHEIEEVIGKVRKLVKKKYEVPQYISAVDEEYRPQILAVLGSDEQVEEYFQTCFDPKYLSREFEEVYEKKENWGGWQDAIEHPEKLAQIAEGREDKKTLKEIWKRDQQTRLKYHEVMQVRLAMRILEQKLLGRAKLSHKKNLDSRGEEKTKYMSWGKFMEKLFTLIHAEKFKGVDGVKIIQVDSNIDYYEGIDLIIEVPQGNGLNLVGFDFTIREENDPEKDMEPRKEFDLDPESITNAFSQKFLKQWPQVLLKKRISISRNVEFNPSKAQFREKLLERLYEKLKNHSFENVDHLFSELYDQVIKSDPDKFTNQKTSDEVVAKARSMIVRIAS